MPLRKGQTLEIEYSSGAETLIKWSASDGAETWFDAEFSLNKSLIIKKTSNDKIAIKLLDLLNAARNLNPAFLVVPGTYSAKNQLDFNRDWGWGSSSTLISNVAWWAEIDPFELNSLISEGSGYDIACARSETPLFYRLTIGNPEIESIRFNPGFSDHLVFIYLGSKQDTPVEINRFIPDQAHLNTQIKEVSAISEQMAASVSLEHFNNLIDRHESIMGNILKRQPVKELLFPDFDGSVKSLGAWGGDFIMASSANDYMKTKRYFDERGYTVAFSWNEIIR